MTHLRRQSSSHTRLVDTAYLLAIVALIEKGWQDFLIIHCSLLIIGVLRLDFWYHRRAILVEEVLIYSCLIILSKLQLHLNKLPLSGNHIIRTLANMTPILLHLRICKILLLLIFKLCRIYPHTFSLLPLRLLPHLLLCSTVTLHLLFVLP